MTQTIWKGYKTPIRPDHNYIVGCYVIEQVAIQTMIQKGQEHFI